MTVQGEAIILAAGDANGSPRVRRLSAKEAARAGAMRAVCETLNATDEVGDYVVRSAEGRWWVVYQSHAGAVGESTRLACLRELREATERRYPGLLDG